MEINETPLILVCDDTVKNVQLVGELLGQEGYDIVAADNGAEAIELVKETNPDLVLMDVMMPGMNGFEACEKIKADKKNEDLPVIFLTAKINIEDVTKGFEVGGVDYVTKPFNPKELIKRVGTHLDLKKRKVEVLNQTQMKGQLIHVLCHDLANPISTALLWLKLLKRSPDDLERCTEKMAMALDNGFKIISLVKEYEAITSGKLELKLHSENLQALIKDSSDILAQQFELKNIKLVNNTSKDLTLKVERVSFVNSVLNNIFTNGIKFSEEGKSITIDSKDSGDGEVELTISDQGIGIPDFILEDLFDPNKVTTRRGIKGEVGTGFGMPLMRKFVEAYGGDIKVESRVEGDTGTKITLILQKGE